MLLSKSCPKCGAKLPAGKSECGACGAISIDISSGRKRQQDWTSIWFASALGTGVSCAIIHLIPSLAKQYFKNDTGYMSLAAFILVTAGAVLGTVVGALRAPRYWTHPVVVIGWIPIIAAFYTLHALAQSALAGFTLDELLLVDLTISLAGPLGAFALPLIVRKTTRRRA